MQPLSGSLSRLILEGVSVDRGETEVLRLAWITLSYRIWRRHPGSSLPCHFGARISCGDKSPI